MQFRKLRGRALFDGDQLWQDRVLLLDGSGKVEAVVPEAEAGEGIEKVEGILLPGLVNAHCHLELSHFRDCIPAGTGLVDFLMAVIHKRKDPPEGKEAAMAAAVAEMEAEGVVAVADICNTTDAIDAKKGSRIRWQSLVELINIMDDSLVSKLAQNEAIRQAHLEWGLSAGHTPHAPYTVSPAALRALNERSRGGLVSVHNQETGAENELFLSGGGDFLRLYQSLGIRHFPFPVPGTRSLPAWIRQFTEGQTILLVHNTFTEEEDLHFALAHARRHGLRLYFCLCPNANLYIENRLPPLDLLVRLGCPAVIGTDSYCSNKQLSMGAELRTLRRHFPQYELPTLLRSLTSLGADALGWPEGGRFQRGKRPGVALLEDEKTFRFRRVI